MSPADFARFSAQELDAFIAGAVKEREKRSDPHPAQAPQQFEATFNPVWHVFLAGENTVVQLRHLGHGWVSIVLPPQERAHLASVLMHHALLAPPAKPAEAAAPPKPVLPTSGGGTIH